MFPECFINQRVILLLRLQVSLQEESPDGELDDELGSALEERLEGGDVPQVVLPLPPPAFLAREDLIGNTEAEVLRPHLLNDV